MSLYNLCMHGRIIVLENIYYVHLIYILHGYTYMCPFHLTVKLKSYINSM